MLYPEHDAPTLSPELFRNPGAEYRAAPFWAWNCSLQEETLHREIEVMKTMGFGGFHMHPRLGLATEYLSDEFLGFIKSCAEKARREHMLAWLYDEDKWPSGYAGGLVTRDPQHREKYMRFTQTVAKGNLLGRYAVALDADGCLKEYRLLSPEESGDALPGARWYAYLESAACSPAYNLQSYVDTLSKSAVERFIEETHERYYQVLRQEFGKLVPGIFTDEPQFTRKQTLREPFAQEDVLLPWTTDFAASYKKAYGEDILEHLPELFWELPGGAVSAARYQYHDHVAERFACAFADTLGAWCGKHNIMLTGHMMMEESLENQTTAVGDCMRHYRAFHLPGVDMLCDSRDRNTVKQAQSAAHQYGRPGVLSELYGVTDWDFRFYQHKLQGDWQAALGVTVRVPHLYWVSMQGEAKRDYPASIGHQSPWYAQYKYIEDHFARVSTALTRGKPLVKIGVIHLVESLWLRWGPNTQTKALRSEMDERFAQLTDWLLLNQLDFDFISEALLPGQYQNGQVGEMRYDVILVPWLETIRSTTVEMLQAYQKSGGEVIFLGELPAYTDAKFNPQALALLGDLADILPWSKTGILQALAFCRLHQVTGEDGAAAEDILSQWREDNGCRWLFLCHANDSSENHTTQARRLRVEIKGEWRVTLYDTITGEIRALQAEYGPNGTALCWHACPQDSLLLRLEPGQQAAFATVPERWKPLRDLPPVNPVTLSEPNVLLLDMPEHALDGGAFQPREEILRIGDGYKKALGFSNALAEGCQPWALQAANTWETHTVHLRYTIQSQVAVAAVKLGIENPANAKIIWNNTEITAQPDGCYVDEAIQTIPLGELRAGENVLELSMAFGELTALENCYLLGDFGVQVRGQEAVVTAPVRELAFGDWTRQGLPFYGGSVTYHASLELQHTYGNALALEAPHFTLPLLGVAMDGHDAGVIAISPWRANLGRPALGVHAIELTAFGNRVNTFGPLHNCNEAARWHGPDTWRSNASHWSYEYQLKPSGILVAPTLLEEVEEA